MSTDERRPHGAPLESFGGDLLSVSGRDVPAGIEEREEVAPDLEAFMRLSVSAKIRADHGWRPAPPELECPWCGAGRGEPCLVVGWQHRPRSAKRLYASADGCHPSRRLA